MIGKRLKEERERLRLSQTDFASLAGAAKRTQIDWEKEVSSPTAGQLAAFARAGADIRYIITGDRDGPAPEVLSAEERVMLERFRASPKALRDAALRVLFGAAEESRSSARFEGSQQNFHAPVSGDVAGRDINKKGKPRR